MFVSFISKIESKLSIYQAKSVHEDDLIIEELENGSKKLNGMKIRLLDASNGVIVDGILTGPVFSNAIGEKKIIAKTGSDFQIEKPIYLSDIKTYHNNTNGHFFAIFEGSYAILNRLFSIQKRPAYGCVGLM